MTITPIIPSDSPLLIRIKRYQKRLSQIKQYLSDQPNEWGRFQSEFNQEVNSIFHELMLFERHHLIKNQENKVYKLKKFFLEKLRKHFLHGDLIKWSLNKPYGYAGDHKIIDDIYLNQPKNQGIDRLFDNYFQMSTISVAVRNRKEDFKRIILESVKRHTGKAFRIMDLASGPCRDVFELLNSDKQGAFDKTQFDCLDADSRAILYARNLLQQDPRARFIEMNIVRLALNKNIERDYLGRYDLIYSTGLFDYFDDRLTLRLLSNLRKLLNPGGILAISDVRDKFSNPSVYFMEWVADWNLVYRNDDRFRDLFIEAGFLRSTLRYNFEQQGILQYVLAQKK